MNTLLTTLLLAAACLTPQTAPTPPEHVLPLRERLVGRRVRAITRDDLSVATHLLRAGY
mgnify:CR=1 FL=1